MARNFAHLKPDCPFYSIFELGMAPIRNILLPSPVLLEGSDEKEAYILDWSKCTRRQQDELADLVCHLRSGRPAEFLEYMHHGGELPIRVSQTSGTSTDSLFFL